MELENSLPLPSDFNIYQYRCFGYSIEETALHYGLDADAVQEAVERYCISRGINNTRSTKERKVLALARLDLATKALMPKLKDGELSAIHAYLKIQEREAKLTGMDSAIKQDTNITIDIPWLTRDRLSYKDANGDVVDNVTDLGPAIEIKKQLEAAQAWREGNPESGRNANVAMDEQIPER